MSLTTIDVSVAGTERLDGRPSFRTIQSVTQRSYHMPRTVRVGVTFRR